MGPFPFPTLTNMAGSRSADVWLIVFRHWWNVAMDNRTLEGRLNAFPPFFLFYAEERIKMKSFLAAALEGHVDEKPVAIIVKGNPKYLNNEKVKPLAEALYAEIKKILEEKGYAVEFDAGKEYTQPREGAAVWIGHSRGIDRLRFAPKGVKTIELQTMDHGKKYKSHDEQGLDPDHYRLSPKDRQALNAL